MTSAELASLILMPSNPKRETIPRAGTGTGAEQAKGKPAAAWPDVEERLRSGESIVWLSLRTDDGVHTRPVFAAWTGTAFVVASNATAVKSRHLDTGDQCSLALDLGATHLTVDAHPARLTEQHDLERASVAFRDVYNWPTTVAGDELRALGYETNDATSSRALVPAYAAHDAAMRGVNFVRLRLVQERGREVRHVLRRKLAR